MKSRCRQNAAAQPVANRIIVMTPAADGLSLALRRCEERNRTTVAVHGQLELASREKCLYSSTHSSRELEPAVGGGSVVVQDDCAKWEWRAGVRCRVTSRSALKEGATKWGQQLRLRLRLPVQRRKKSSLEEASFRGRSSSCCATLPGGEALPSEKLSTCERTPRQRSV